MRESLIESEVCQWAKLNDILAIKFTPMGETGWPDRIFLYMGRVAFIEFKAPGKKPRPMQDHRIKKLRIHEFTVGVYDNVTDAIAFLDATLLSSGGRKDNVEPSQCGSTDGPRLREDELHLHGAEDSARQRLHQAYFSDMPATSGIPSLATPKRQVR